MHRTLPREDEPLRWIAEVRGRGVESIAAMLGLEPRRSRSLTPCPACGAEERGSGDHRGPIGIEREGLGWLCHRCQAQGDAVTLAAFRITGGKSPTRDVRRACAAAGLCDPDPRDGAPPPTWRKLPTPAPRAPTPPKRPPADEVEALWAACRPLAEVPEVVRYLVNARRWPAAWVAHAQLLDLARALPLDLSLPSWWPAAWAATWRLVVPAFEADGRIASIHARAIDPAATPKTLWPKDHEAGGLLFADPRGAALLRGETQELTGVLVTEGLTKTMAAALWAHQHGKPLAALGFTSGGARAFAEMRWPAGLPCYIATDSDTAGEKYAAEVREALPRSVRCLRLRLERKG